MTAHLGKILSVGLKAATPVALSLRRTLASLGLTPGHRPKSQKPYSAARSLPDPDLIPKPFVDAGGLPGAVAATENAVRSCILGMISEGVLVADMRAPDGALVYVNRAFEEITGYPANEAVGRNCRYLQGSDRSQPEIAAIRAAIESRQSAAVTLRNYRKNGQLFWNELSLAPVLDTTGGCTHYVGIIRDVTRLKETTFQLRRASHEDPVTEVANRYGFFEELEALRTRSPASFTIVAKLDVARFHELNTSYGYDAGDALLMQFAERLSRIPGAVVGRLGSNEFALAAVFTDSDGSDVVLDEIRAALSTRFEAPDTQIKVYFALGFTVGTSSVDAVTLLRQADIALNESKGTSGLEARRFDSRTDALIQHRVRLTNELHHAVANGDFELFFQPKVDLSTGRMIGAEALLRWQHAHLGMQSPADFIPIAEESGLILDIGAWVLRSALAFAVEVNRARATPLVFSINVSQVEFKRRDIVKLVRTMLRESGAEPAWLMLELTENVLAESSPEMIAVFQALRDMGIGLSIDDFGTGYSSLRYLENFPVSEVKIDKIFIRDMAERPGKRVIVDAVIQLGRAFDIAVTAEGIETVEQRALLEEAGCPQGQGFLFGRPMPAAEFLRFDRATAGQADSEPTPT